MNIVTEYSSDGTQFTISIKGIFDFNLVQEFRHAYANINPTVDTVIVDFRETEYMDSSALGMLLNMRKSVSTSVQSVRLMNCRPEIRRTLDISRFDKLFQID